MNIKTETIPQALKDRKQWVCWKTVKRDGKETKIPYRSATECAKSNDPATWMAFDDAIETAIETGMGIGFVFSADDEFCGVDLDGCRDPKSGSVSDWAKEIIVKFASYAEVSPSETGVKIFCRGASPVGGKKIELDVERFCAKTPAIEVYDRLRYFAVTGWRLKGAVDVADCGLQLAWLKEKFFPDHTPKPFAAASFRSDDAVFERARKYLAKLPAAISGSGGHNATFHAACVLVLGFELGESDALSLLSEYNQRCDPPWSERELEHKIRSAVKQPGERGYLRNAKPERWENIKVPSYREPPKQEQPTQPASTARTTTLVDASKRYLESIRHGQTPLIDTGIYELDYALGGGVQRGEMVIFAARPSHGKSAVALQMVHHWTSQGIPCAFISEEMSDLALGKRAVQYVTEVPEDMWSENMQRIESELAEYEQMHARCEIIEGCGSVDNAVAQIERVVKDQGVQCVVVDYAQLLRANGRTRYEQVTNTSVALRKAASTFNIVLLALCQLSRGIESRDTFVPVMSDLKETGQLEQDADVITFLVWPYKVDPSESKERYQFFVVKNRNRAIRKHDIDCRFLPDRQRFLDQLPQIDTF